MTGNKYQLEEDMPALPGVLGLEIVRHYNSMFSAPGQPNGVIGRGWRLSYEIELVDRWGKIQILEADGGRVIFDRNPKAPTGCSTLDPSNGTMAIGRQPDGRPDYTWTWTSGRKLHFNSAGKLDSIKMPTGETLRLIYDSQNVLVRVIDPQGRSLNLVYYDPEKPNQFHGVQFIDSPVGRFAYEYGSALPKGGGLFDQRQLLANLVRVRLPDDFAPDTRTHALSSRGTTTSTTSRIYHHEDPRSPWLMTGISIETIGTNGKPVTARYATYGYDDAGRAILSTHAGNVDKVMLDFHEVGKTVLTNSLGQQTTYRYSVIAGEYRLKEIRGAGCALCGEPNVRYDYDSAGRVIETTKLFENGERAETIRADRDKLGRVTRVSRMLYEHGKPKSLQLQVRFEYRGNGYAPALVARPSVVPGKELVTLFDYNEAGQPLSVTEAGWSPSADEKHAVTKIERVFRYHYAWINGRSLLIEIDGALPNGRSNTPLDSDITLIEYDHRGNARPQAESPTNASRLVNYQSFDRQQGVVTAIITPGNRRSEIEYDYAGRIATIKDPGGNTTTLRYTPHGQLRSISQHGLTYSTFYDSLNKPVESGYSDGVHYHALARFGYDEAGRNKWTASSLGVAQTRRFDTEGELLEQSTMSGTIKRTQRYEYDNLGHLRAITAADGGIRRVNWNAMGLPDALIDALGRPTRFGYDDAGRITTVADANSATTRFELDVRGRSAAVITPNGATTRYVRDDFGRIVATIGADSGKTTRIFDAADRLIVSIDANGNRAGYEYDVMGRIVSQRVTDALNGGKQTVTTWRYEGTHLVAIDHPNQMERYGYDAQDRVTAKTVILTLGGDAKVSYTTRYRYNALGQLAGVTLVDGSNLDYIRNGQNQITALERRPTAKSWLSVLLPRQTIVRDVERDLVGIKRLMYGNGIGAYYQRSDNGSLARIAYRAAHAPGSLDPRSSILDALLGIRPARAAPAALPGALSLPSDPDALLDHRYLWDAQGNLLYTRDKNAVSGYAYDALDHLIAATTVDARAKAQAVEKGTPVGFSRYYYDSNGNRVLAQDGFDQQDIQGKTVKTSYAPEADRWTSEASGKGRLAEAHYDAGGQPERTSSRTLVWDALGKLREVRDGQRTLARYRYNHRGERIEKIVGNGRTYYLYEDRKLVAELNGKGRICRQYVYLAQQPVAVIDNLSCGAPREGGGTALTRHVVDLSEVSGVLTDKAESIVYLHSNHIGATELATDANGKPIWRSAYDPYGQFRAAAAQKEPALEKTDFELNLRLPGQYVDKETGLYYNDYRYYEPSRGRYLSPDPIGLAGGSNGYAYVNNNPLKYIDPQGLVLFAFDGTGNTNDQTWLTANASSFSNVWQFRQLYDDGNRRYVSGVGTIHHDLQYGDINPAKYTPVGSELTDMGGNYSGPARIQRMLQYFTDEADLAADNDPMEIDIVGFSRGAAEARSFANWLIAKAGDGRYIYYDSTGHQRCQRVDFRFIGLFDTVLSTNLSGAVYDLRIPEAFAYAAQAVALNEHRGENFRRLPGSTGAFPLESIMGIAAPTGKIRIERGFLGSHGDIGGGFGPNENQLSQVALAWMVDQAKAAGIKMKVPDELHTIIANPVIHDKSNNQYSTAGAPVAPGLEDRVVNYQNRKTTKQMTMTGVGMTWADTQKYISYLPAVTVDRGQTVRFPRGDFVTGTVDMKGYLDWLNRNGYNINIKVQ